MRRGYSSVAFMLIVALQACVPVHAVGYSAIGALTLKVAPDREVDAVWLLRVDGAGSEVTQTILRCHNAEQGPICVPAKIAAQ